MRPFSQTMQAHQFDPHRLWMVLLLSSIFLALAWIGWATSDRFAVYTTSTSLKLQPKITIATSHEQNGNVVQAKARRQRWLEAIFPAAARSHVTVGREVAVFVDGVSIPVVITEVHDDSSAKEIRVILRAESSEDTPDHFAKSSPENVRIPIGSKSPLEIWLPEVTPSQTPKSLAPERVQK